MTVNELKKIALLKKEQNSNNLVELEKINNIISMLNDDMCFFKIDINLAIPILLYLGISEDIVKNVYFELISSKNFKTECEVRKCIGK